MKYITIKLTDSETLSLISTYKSYETAKPSAYVLFAARTDDVEVTVYTNTKGKLTKVVFKGEAPEQAALEFKPAIEHKVTSLDDKPQTDQSVGFVDYNAQIGSDEVGFGDYFGPLVVAAAYCGPTEINELIDLGVTDSKKMNDTAIMTLGPLLVSKYDYHVFIVDNRKYNATISKEFNMNKMKAMLHNRALAIVKLRHPNVPLYIDQFSSAKKFASYLQEPLVTDLNFIPQGDAHYPSVALASVIARYHFLTEINKLNQQYRVKIPLGASASVDQFAIDFIAEYGETALRNITKANFINNERIFKKE